MLFVVIILFFIFHFHAFIFHICNYASDKLFEQPNGRTLTHTHTHADTHTHLYTCIERSQRICKIPIKNLWFTL